MTTKNLRDKKLKQILELEKTLDSIQDIDVLLERILTETRAIVSADAGSIYVVDGENLRIKYAQNDTRLKKLAPGEKLPYTAFVFPISKKSIAGYVALTGESLNIKDVYKIDDKPFTFNKNSDLVTHYRTKSMYTLPLKTSSGHLLGVMQLLNAQNEKQQTITFSNEAELFINHFATNASRALQTAYQTNVMIQRMLKMAEFRDPKETYPHVNRVAEVSIEIYDRWAYNHNIAEEDSHLFRDCLKIAARFHDIGKVGIPDDVLKSNKKFLKTDNSFTILKGHTCIGAQIFGEVNSLLDTMCMETALHHHEWFDGSHFGYPGAIDYKTYSLGDEISIANQMRGEDIPLAARIIAVADVFDALSHKRSYKDSWTFNDAVSEIQKESGTHFDPEIVDAFLQVQDRVAAINEAFPDDE